MSEVTDRSIPSRFLVPLVFLFAFGAIGLAHGVGTLVGAAFLPEGWIEFGPLLFSGFILGAGGYVLGSGRWAMLMVAAILVANWRLAGQGFDVITWLTQSSVMIVLFASGVLLATAFPRWRSL